jgi:hypothetical protein
VRARRLKIIFTEKFPPDGIGHFVGSDALGLGTVYRANDTRVVLVKATGEKEYKILKEQLDIWMSEGLATYEEQT